MIKRKIIVQKYGGTSVNTPERRQNIIKNAREIQEAGYCPIIVVSAMGRYPEAYSTDALLKMLPENATSRNRDLIASCGEIISAAITSQELINAGLPALALTGAQAGIATDGHYTESEITSINIDKLVSLCENNVIPVVAGFQGVGADNEVTTLGRGGSDTTAAAIGNAIGAYAIQIFTDVNGIYITDPKLCGNVKIISVVNYSDVYKMANMGAKVIHPRAVSYAAENSTDMYVLNVNEPLGSECTKICNDESVIAGLDGFCAITVSQTEKGEAINVMGSIKNTAKKIKAYLKSAKADAAVNEDNGIVTVSFAFDEAKAHVEGIYNCLIGE